LLGLVQVVQAHPAKDLGCLRELDLPVVDDLDLVAPGVEEVEAPAGLELDAGVNERLARRLLVVDDETEVARPIRGLRSPLGERDELVAQIDEGHAPGAAAKLELEDPAVELECFVDAPDLERDVVDADESGHGSSLAPRQWLNPAMAITGIYETVLYAEDVAAAAAFYADILGLRLVDGPDELAAAFRLDDGGVLLIFDPSRSSVPGRPAPSHGATGAGHVAFSVDKGTLDAWADSFRGRGIQIELERPWQSGGRSIYVRDPAGNSVELVEGDFWPA
jgi:catechol 2,3-dioxygenase-like lactoylglutathione lyase family enzyme